MYMTDRLSLQSLLRVKQVMHYCHNDLFPEMGLNKNSFIITKGIRESL